MLAPRRWLDRSAVVGLAACVLACFTDAPPLDEDTGSTSAADTTAADDDNGSTTATIGDDESASPDATSSPNTVTTEEASSDVDAESETGHEECSCPADVLLCDGFEAELRQWLPPAGDPPPAISGEEVQCGAGALLSSMPADQTLSTISAEVTSDAPLALPWSFGGWYFLGGSCLTGAPVRILRLWFDDGGVAPPEYLVDIVVDDSAVRLRAIGPSGDDGIEGSFSPVITDEWVPFRVDFDLSLTNAPQISATIGDSLVVVTDPPIAPSFDAPRIYPTLGASREGAPQTELGCNVVYDDVWFGPTQ
jgi:hypothetical protein